VEKTIPARIRQGSEFPARGFGEALAKLVMDHLAAASLWNHCESHALQVTAVEPRDNAFDLTESPLRARYNALECGWRTPRASRIPPRKEPIYG
jgi:hypothetical protein